MIVKERVVLYFYVVLWLLYELQGLFWSAGNVLSLVIIVLFTALSLYYGVKVNLLYKDKPGFFTALNLLLLMFTVYGIVYVLDGSQVAIGVAQEKPYNYLKQIYNSLLPIYTFYYFSRKRVIDQRFFMVVFPIFLVVAIASFWHFDEVMKQRFVQKGYTHENVINYKCYAFLSLFSLLSVYRKKPVIQILGIVCLMTFIFVGMKRGAIFVGMICTALYLVDMFQRSKGFKKVLIILLSLTVILLLSFWVGYLLETNDFFVQRFQNTMEGNTSGRDSLYHTFFLYYLHDTNVFQFFFGSGANATLSISYNYAHNDWLELAINQGVLGYSLYLYFFVEFFRSWRRMERTDFTYFAFGLLLLVSFLKTLFSRTYGDMDIYTTSMLGYCLGTLSRHTKQEKP